MDNVIQPLPEFVETNGKWSMQGEISEGHIYEMAFDGTDAHAEIIERATDCLSSVMQLLNMRNQDSVI